MVVLTISVLTCPSFVQLQDIQYDVFRGQLFTTETVTYCSHTCKPSVNVSVLFLLLFNPFLSVLIL